MKTILANALASNNCKQTHCAKCGSVGDFISRCGGKHAYHTAWDDLRKTNALRNHTTQSVATHSEGRRITLSLSLSR